MVPISQVVKDYMNERGFASSHGFARYLGIAIQGYKILDRDISGQIQKCEVSVLDNLTADLPKNCIKVMGLSKLINDTFYPLTQDDDQAPVATDSSGDEVVSTNDTSMLRGGMGGFYNTTTTNFHGEFIGRIYGLAGRYNGTWTENKALNRIEFGRNINTDNPIWIFFLGDPDKVDGKYMVNELLVEPIKLYLHWVDMRFKRSAQMGRVEQAKNDWNNAKIKAAVDTSSQRRTILEDLIRRGHRMTKF